MIVIAPEPPASSASLLSSVLPRVPSETVEGMHELLAALASDGALFAVVTGEPAALRFALTAMDALRLDGSNRPTTRIVVQRAVDHYGVWVGRGTMPMDALLELHARDRNRRVAGSSQPPAPSLPPWAASAPTLLHTPVALFDERMSRILRQHEQEPASSQLPAYAFDIAPLHDERPLFFELARWDRPDTWVEGSLYMHALELLGLALLAWLVVGWLAARRQPRKGREGMLARAASLLRVVAHGALLGWSAQAMTRVLADPQRGALAAVAGLTLGALLGWRLRRNGPTRRSVRFASLGGAAVFLALAPAAWAWTAVVSRVDGLPPAQGLALAVGTCAVLGAPIGGLMPRLTRRPEAGQLATLACALLAAFAAVAVAVLFGDFRVLGVVAAATGLLSVAGSSRAGYDLHGSATQT